MTAVVWVLVVAFWVVIAGNLIAAWVTARHLDGDR